MKGTSFPESNTKLRAPKGMEDQVYDLPVWQHPQGDFVMSKWKMTWRERLHCLFRGHVWLHSQSNTHPPITIETFYPFQQEKSWKGWLFFIVFFFLSLSLGLIVVSLHYGGVLQ